MLLSAAYADARDFPDPYATIDPLYLLAADGPGAVMDWEFNHQLFRSSDLDDFQLHLVGAAGLFRVGDRFALGMRYGVYLFTGPGGRHLGTPYLEWRMNSVQFQYGLHAAFALGPTVRLFAEYSRGSDHPFGSHPEYRLSDVSYDRVAVGVGLPRFDFGIDGTVTGSFRLGYVDLWDAWDAQGTDTPRVEWLARTSFQVLHGIKQHPVARHRLKALAELSPDIFTLHDQPGIDANFSGRIGIRLEHQDTSRAIDVYFDAYFSRDTEAVVGEAFPVALTGIGFRIGNASRM